jgi:phosphatidylinositol alpha-1,6-mannosyltransferase
MIAGDDPKDSLTHRSQARRVIEALTREMKLDGHVRFLGAVSDDQLINCYHACDLVVLPALHVEGDAEGFGIVLLEAAAAGKPVVATSVGGIPDAVENGETGMLVGAGDYPQLTRSIISLINDERARAAMGERARQRAREKFSWVRIVEQYEKALNLQMRPRSRRSR